MRQKSAIQSPDSTTGRPSGAKPGQPGPVPGWLKQNWQFAIFPISLATMFWSVLAGKQFFWEDALQFGYPSLAYLLSRMHYPDFPEPMGVFRAVDRPKYDERLNAQVADAIQSEGPGDLDKLFRSGDTWVVT